MNVQLCLEQKLIGGYVDIVFGPQTPHQQPLHHHSSVLLQSRAQKSSAADGHGGRGFGRSLAWLLRKYGVF